MFKSVTKLWAERHRTITKNEGQWSMDIKGFINHMKFHDDAEDDRTKVCASSLALIRG
jgi:hypothetical protein